MSLAHGAGGIAAVVAEEEADAALAALHAHPLGRDACVVSPEGACAAYYNFGRLLRDTALVGSKGPDNERSHGSRLP